MRTWLTPMKWFVILTVLAVLLALVLPPDPHAVHRLHTTATSYRIAIAILLLPYTLIWYAAFYAFAKLSEYSRPLKRTEDGAAFHTITTGLAVVAFSLIVPTIIALILHNLAGHYPWLNTAVVIAVNYIAIFPGLFAFLILYNGARELVRTLRDPVSVVDLRWHAPWFLVLSGAFTFLTIQNQYKTHAYHLPVWILLLTFIVPYLYGWMVGLLAARELHVYAKAVKGILYRRGINQFGHGISATIIGSIGFQFVNITIAQRLDHSLVAVMIFQLLLLAIVATGLVLMALGTKKLKTLEEVR